MYDEKASNADPTSSYPPYHAGRLCDLQLHGWTPVVQLCRPLGVSTHSQIYTQLNIYQVYIYIVEVMTNQYCT